VGRCSVQSQAPELISRVQLGCVKDHLHVCEARVWSRISWSISRAKGVDTRLCLEFRAFECTPADLALGIRSAEIAFTMVKKSLATVADRRDKGATTTTLLDDAKDRDYLNFKSLPRSKLHAILLPLDS
jgi:hypothetical protein